MIRDKNDLLAGSRTQLEFQRNMRSKKAPHRKFAPRKGIKAFVIEDECID